MVKCSECGFLALRVLHGMQPGNLESADELYREGGIPAVAVSDPGYYYHVPLCFMAVVDFKDEIKVFAPSEIVESITRERPCGEWTEWKFGRTPKEHQEIIERRSLIKWRMVEVVAIGVITVVAAIAGAIAGGYIASKNQQPVQIINQMPSPSQSGLSSNAP